MGRISQHTDELVKQTLITTQDATVYEVQQVAGSDRQRICISLFQPLLHFNYNPLDDRTIVNFADEDEDGILREIYTVTPHRDIEEMITLEDQRLSSSHMNPNIQLRPHETTQLRDGQIYIRSKKTNLRDGLRLIEEPTVRYGTDPERTIMNLARLTRMLLNARFEAAA